MFTELELDHPVKRLRGVAGLTQRQLADRIDDMSEQYIRRVEHGLVGQNTDLSRIYHVLHNIIDYRHKSEDRESFYSAMAHLLASYVTTAMDLETPELASDDTELIRSFANGDWMLTMQTNLALVTDDWYLLKRYHLRKYLRGQLGSYRTFREFRKDFMRAIGYEGPVSSYSFCSVLGLHVFTIQRFEMLHTEQSAPFDGANAGGWPVDLRRALHEAGVDWHKIKFTGRDHARSAAG